MRKMKEIVDKLLLTIWVIVMLFGWPFAAEKLAEDTYNTYDRQDFYKTYESAWEQVESNFFEARDIIFYSGLDEYYMNNENDYFVVVRKFSVYYNTKHVDNYEYKLVMYGSDIVLSEYWEV